MRSIAYASISKAAYHVALGQRDSAETALRRTVSLGFNLADGGNVLVDQLIGTVIVGVGRDALIELYLAYGDPRGAQLRATTDSVIAAIEARNSDNLSVELDGVSAQDAVALRTMMIRTLADESEMRGLRLEMLSLLAIAPCTNVKELVFGPSDYVQQAFDHSRKEWTRFPADSAFIDMVQDTPARLSTLRPEGVPNALWVGVQGVSRLLFNQRFAGCSALLLRRVSN